MIVLDTHIWIWWVHGDKRLKTSQSQIIAANESKVIGISAISVGKLQNWSNIIDWNYLAL
jgi:PIN domain nuclease of toxin-antitoxin system